MARHGAALLIAVAALFAGVGARSEPARLLAPHLLRFDGDQRAPLAPGSEVTPLRLLRELYPDLNDAGAATRTRSVRSLDPQDPTMGQVDAADGAADLAGGTEAAVVRVGDSAFALAAGVLVAARIAPHYHLLDAAFVQDDPGGPAWIERAFDRPAGPVVLVGGGHHNSSESFATYQLIGAIGGRLTLLHPSLFLYSWQAPRRGCPMERSSLSLAHLALRPGGTLVATVRQERTCERGARTLPLGRRLFTIRFVWDAPRRRYRADTGALDAVSARTYHADND